MNKHNIFEFKDRDTITDTLTEMLQTGAQQLIHQAVQVEHEELLELYSGSLTRDGKAAVVRNGYLPERQILTGIGPVTLRIPTSNHNMDFDGDLPTGDFHPISSCPCWAYTRQTTGCFAPVFASVSTR